MRRAAKVDANHTEVGDAFLRCGCSVKSVAMVPKFVDYVVASGRVTFLVEVKDGDKPKSAQALTEHQQNFHSGWKGEIYIVTSAADVPAVIVKAHRDAEAAF